MAAEALAAAESRDADPSGSPKETDDEEEEAGDGAACGIPKSDCPPPDGPWARGAGLRRGLAGLVLGASPVLRRLKI